MEDFLNSIFTKHNKRITHICGQSDCKNFKICPECKHYLGCPGDKFNSNLKNGILEQVKNVNLFYIDEYNKILEIFEEYKERIKNDFVNAINETFDRLARTFTENSKKYKFEKY